MAKEKTQKKKRFGGRLLTTAIVVLCVSGVGIMAYPFVLTGVMEHNKDTVVRQLEAELPIYRNPEDFVPVDVATMEKVDTPNWTAEEKAQAANPMGVWETLVGDDARSAIANAFTGSRQEKNTVGNLPVGALATLIPQVAQGGTFSTLAPREEPAAPAEATLAPSATPQPTEPAADGVVVSQATYPPSTSAQVSSGAQVASASTPATAAPRNAAAPGETQGPTPMDPGAPEETPETGEVQPAPAAKTPELLVGATLSPMETDGEATASPMPTSTAPTDEERDLEAERQAALAEILRDEVPVYYEDFADTMTAAETLLASMDDLSLSLASDRQQEIPGEVRMTFQGIQSQLLAMQSLFTVVDELPSTTQAYAVFPRKDGGEERVLISDGIGQLYDTLKELSRAHVTIQTVAVYPGASQDVQYALDETVYISDQLQNVLDYMTQYLSDADGDLYVRYRASSMVGETEAAYLLEIPSIDLKVGAFPDLTFEQMYKSMRKGAAMFPRVGAPNTNTNISMSAHRTGSAAFFKSFEQIQKGDEILLHTRTLGSFRYLVEGVAVTEDDDWSTTYFTGYPALTLISCEEFGGISHGKRIVVRGRLMGRAGMQ